MSVNKYSVPENESLVVSKFFIKDSMDESGSDFKEEKQKFVGPKSSTSNIKGSKTKSRNKNTIKKIKGQKDIRKALKPKQNELVSYSKQFENVCKKSGIDIDSEELQLAIALSESLHSSNCDKDKLNLELKPQSSVQRTSKIRTKLQEYGFKVPELKQILPKSKKNRRLSQSRLLLISESERKQLIADKYSEVLFSNINHTPLINQVNEKDHPQNGLYYLTTSVPYNIIQNNFIYYIDNLLEQSSTSLGSLLKDWSLIPGRPLSPVKVQPQGFSFDLNDYDIDLILSGTMKVTQNTIKSKMVSIDLTAEDKDKDTVNKGSNKHSETENKNINDLDISQNLRCNSPDMFDDDQSVIESSQKSSQTIAKVDVLKNNTAQNNATKRKSNDFMDITECVNILHPVINSIQSQPEKDIPAIDLTQNDIGDTRNISHSKYNCDMETTECVVPMQSKILCTEAVDLTQEIDDNDKECNINKEHIDLTQSYDDEEYLPYVHLSSQNMDGNECLPEKECSQISKTDSFFDEYVFDHSDKKEDSKEDSSLEKSSNTNPEIEVKVDLTQSSESNGLPQVLTQDHIDSLGKKNDVSIDYDECENVDTVIEKDIEDNNVRHSESLEDQVIDDYDYMGYELNMDFCDYDKENSNHNTETVSEEPASQVFEISDEELNYSVHQSKIVDNSQSSSKNYNLSNDNTDDTSSKVSVTQIVSDYTPEVTKNYLDNTVNVSLPNVEIKGIEAKRKSFDSSKASPPKQSGSTCSIETPQNKDYVIKTVDVTPMVDYASLSTPDRNRELDKYGLKPFKRKRAIQLLTHLYEQTHPVIESIEGSPSKKLRKSELKDFSPSKKLITSEQRDCKELTKPESPKKRLISKDKNDLFCETNTISGSIEIECSEEDMVFQKREKAKIHTCRVPLHIAFHNYVASRRKLREAILRYEPVDIETIHKELVSYGYKYDSKDLLKFLDKKCITVKTADNNNRNKKS